MAGMRISSLLIVSNVGHGTLKYNTEFFSV
jgi:hypothetical protein